MSRDPLAVLVVAFERQQDPLAFALSIKDPDAYYDGEGDSDLFVTIAGEVCPILIGDEYDEAYQIPFNHGNVVVFKTLTYGYGESATWSEVEQTKNSMEAWAKSFEVPYTILIVANYL